MRLMMWRTHMIEIRLESNLIKRSSLYIFLYFILIFPFLKKNQRKHGKTAPTQGSELAIGVTFFPK